MRLAMAEQMSPAPEPSLCLCRLESSEEGLSCPSEMTSGMEEIEDGDSGGKTGAVDPPKASPAIAEPDDERRDVHPLAGGF